MLDCSKVHGIFLLQEEKFLLMKKMAKVDTFYNLILGLQKVSTHLRYPPTLDMPFDVCI